MEMRYYYRILSRHRWTILMTALVCVGLMAVLLLVKGPRYQASVLVREQPLAGGTSRVFGLAESRGRTRERLANLGALATGQEVKARTQARLGMDPTSGEWSFEVTAGPVGWSELLEVSVRSGHREKLPSVANTLVEELASYYRDLSLAEMEGRREFVERGMREAERAYEEAQAELDRYKKEKGVVALDSQTMAVLERLAALRADATAATVDLERVGAMQSAWRGELAGPARERAAREAVEANPAVVTLRARLAEQETELAGLRLRYTDEHRAVREAQRAVEQTKGRLQEETTKALASLQGALGSVPASMWSSYVSLETESAAARARREALERAIARAEGQLPELVDRESGLARLLLARDAAMATYGLFRSKLAEMSAEEREIQGSSPIQVVEAARGTRSVSRVPEKLALALALGLMLGVAVAMLLHYLDNTIQDVEDARALQLPVQAVVPMDATPLAALGDGSEVNGAAEPYHLLRANLFYGQRTLTSPALMVTAAMPRAGKSTVAANLAATLARDGHRVLLVDADLRRPTQHLLFGMEQEPGLTEVLLGRASLGQAIRRTQVPGLSLLSSGSRPENAPGLLSSEAMRRTMAELRELAEVVLFDTSPGSCFADAAFVASHVGNVLLVVAPGESQPSVERSFIEQLGRIGARLVGVVVNKSRPEHAPGYYHYYEEYRRAAQTGQRRSPGRALAPMRPASGKAPEAPDEPV